MTSGLLVAAAILLVVVAPRLLSRWTALRRSPRAALALWQAMALSGVLCVLAAAPVAVFADPPWRSDGLGSAVALASLAASGLVVSQLVLHGHVVGRRLRTARRTQRDLVDLVGKHGERGLRVVPHESLRAYCVPALRHRRLVLTDATVAALPPDELEAVLSHERAHLRERHDLLLELFTVLHRAAPAPVRAPQALHEVRLLVEALADRAARRECGAVPVGRALVALAGSPAPAGALGIGTPDPTGSAQITDAGTIGASVSSGPLRAATARLRLLSGDPAPVSVTAGVYLAAAVVLLAPPALVMLTWLA